MKSYFIVAVLLWPLVAVGQARYRVIDLEAGSGLASAESYAFGLNDQAEVVGFVITTGIHPFRFTMESGMEDLGLPPGSGVAEGLAINTAGEIAGWSIVLGVHRAFRYSVSGGFADLGGLGGSWAEAYGINNHGEVTGTAETLFGEPPPNGDEHVFRYRGGGMEELLGLRGSDSRGFAINDFGDIAGQADGDAFVYLASSGAFFYLGPGRGRAINNHGVAVGSDGGQAFLLKDGAVKLLGSLGGPDAEALGINESNSVVGTSMTTDGYYSAFIWTQVEGMADLNSQVRTEPSWFLENAFGVNNRGQIVGEGWDASFSHRKAVLLDPILPVARVEAVGPNVIVSWSPDWPGVVLESNDMALGGNWQTYPTQGTNVVAVSLKDRTRFFRLNLEALRGLAF